MKKAILAVAIIVTVLTGCNTISTNVPTSNTTRFDITSIQYSIDGYKYSEVIDKDTGNIYLLHNGGNLNTNIIPLYDQNGKITNVQERNASYQKDKRSED